MTISEKLRAEFERLDRESIPIRNHQGKSRWYEALAGNVWITSAQTALESCFPKSHAVLTRWNETTKDRTGEALMNGSTFEPLRAIFRTAARLVADGMLVTLRESARAETVVELLDQAGEHCKEGALVAATVVAGGALETHLLHLCEQNGITWTGDGSIGKYDGAISKARNDGTAEVYSAARSRDIAAWGKRRNDAAHKPTEYDASKPVVELTIEGIRVFVRETTPDL